MKDRTGQAQKRVAVVEREWKAEDAEDRECRWLCDTGLADVIEEPEQPDREGQRGELAHGVEKVVAAARPPRNRHAPPAFARGHAPLRPQSRFPSRSTNPLRVSS